MLLYYDRRFETVEFAVTYLTDILRRRGVFIAEHPLDGFVAAGGMKSIVVSLAESGVRQPSRRLAAEGFEIKVDDNVVYVTGADRVGTMYGVLELAEMIDMRGPDGVQDRTCEPFLKMRGVKFNLPFEPYDAGDPFEKNLETCADPEFWSAYIDFLAANRYNCLSLWSEHPYHLMFRLDKYPDTCPLSDLELERYQQLWRFIFRRAAERGLATWLITWNIRITPFVAEGLGLPADIGDMADRYDVIYRACNGLPVNCRQFDAVRQHLDVVRDYLKECIKTLLLTYRDLTGIGTSCSEEMVGDPATRQRWVTDVYAEAVRECGRVVPFIHRTNSSNGRVTKELFLDKYPGEDTYISWKYSNAHMWSHPAPQFEELWSAWEGVDMNKVRVLYTVRNDDFHTLRGGDPEFLKSYFRAMEKPYVHGYYWGADGYIWADDFQHVPHGHKTWRYDFEKHWYEFELLGRLGYDPDVPDEVWIGKMENRYGPGRGHRMFRAFKAASKIIPAVNRVHWINYDFQWHPESLLTANGFRTIADFVNSEPMPGSGTIGIREFVENELAGGSTAGETPGRILSILDESVEDLALLVEQIGKDITQERLGGEILCTWLDMKAWRALGSYYRNKIAAALELVTYELTGDEDRKSEAVQHLARARDAWKDLSLVWAQHYMPYKMVRSKYTFGWPYYLEAVERDIELAATWKARPKNAQ
jgi:hypothetical protein